MGLNASKVKGSGGPAQELIKKAAHFGRVVQVLDLGVQPRKAYQGAAKKPCQQLWVTYEMVNLFMKDEDGNDIKDKPRWLSEKLNLFSLDQENALSTKRMLALDPEGELNGDWERVGGMPCAITVTHSKCGKYANVGGMAPPMDGIDVPELVNPFVFFDIDAPDMEVFNNLPQFLQDYMTKTNIEFAGSVLQKAINGKSATTTPAETAAQGGDEEEEEPPY